MPRDDEADKNASEAPRPAKSRLLTRRTALRALGTASLAGAIDAFAVEPSWLETTLHELPVTGLPKSLDGLSLAHITDAHLNGLGKVEQAILEQVRGHNVQVVVLTGDIVDDPRALSWLAELLDQLNTEGRKLIATLGNWEHWAKFSLEELKSTYARASAELLVNETVATHGIALTCTDDFTAGNPSLESANANHAAHARLLLTHSPTYLDQVSGAPPFDLCLSGHTHGGQLRLTSAVVPFVPTGSGRFVAGSYQTPAGPAYVSRGTGTSIVPARFTCRPELPIFRLRQG